MESVFTVGDWDGSGTVKVGIGRNGCWQLNTTGSNHYQAGVDTVFNYGPGFTPLMGH
jgi:hypothetical protein